jgi:general stress protein 26
MFEQEVLDLVRTETAFLGNIDGDQPRVRPMKPYVDREGHIWLFSPYATHKVDELKKNPRIELCVVGKNDDMLTLTGRVKDETRPGSPLFRATLDLMYAEMPEMRKYFPERDTTSLVLFRVIVHEVRYVRQGHQLVTRVNIPMEQSPEVELEMCQGGFCLLQE